MDNSAALINFLKAARIKPVTHGRGGGTPTPANTPTPDDGSSTLLKLLAAQLAQNQSNQGLYQQNAQGLQQFMNTQSAGAGTVLNGVLNGAASNGVPVSPASVLPAYNSLMNDNMTKLAGAYDQVGTAQNVGANLAGTLATAQNQQAQTGLQGKQLNLNAAEAGLTDNGNGGYTYGIPGTTSAAAGVGANNPLVALHVKNIMNGTESPDDASIPRALQPIVKQVLTAQGYDPAKQLNGDLAQLKQLYFGQGGQNDAIAGGGNWGNSVNDIFSQILGKTPIKTSRAQQIEQYKKQAQAFTQKYGKALGTTVLPDTSNTYGDAQKAFAALDKTVSNKFYQGQAAPGTSTAASAKTVKVGKYTVSY